MEEHKSKAQRLKKPHYDPEEWQKSDRPQLHDCGEHFTKEAQESGLVDENLPSLNLYTVA